MARSGLATKLLRTRNSRRRGIRRRCSVYHGQSVEALPLIIETLKNQGYHFITWNGTSFADDAPRITQAIPDPPPTLYHESWAVIIGIDDYAKWPKLRYAVNDANGMKEILLRKYGFKPEKVQERTTALVRTVVRLPASASAVIPSLLLVAG